jgi:DNA (cytosine-5)-methyltransferase 1
MIRTRIPTLSLFSGAGGLDIGFHKAGFDIVACVEIERAYCDTLEANIGKRKFFGDHTKVYCQDIREFDPKPFKKLGIRCIIGGPPCQTFSAAGRRSGGVIGIRDERGQLFKTYCEILRKVKPEVFVFENVYGISGANGGESWKEIVAAFGDLGYHLRIELLDAADYGVPQHRERLFIVGSVDGKFEFPLPTHGPDSRTRQSLVSVSDAICDLQDPKEPYHAGVGGMYGHLLPQVPEGLNYAFFTAEMGHPEPQFAWRSKFHDLLYKVNPDEPCRTIKAQPGKFTGPFHWKNRHFTTDELKRLQSFPDKYEVVGSPNKILEQIGNSVPPQLAYVLAMSVRQQELERTSRLTFSVRSFGFQSTFRQRQRERTKNFKKIATKEITLRYRENSTTPNTTAPSDDAYFISAISLFNQKTLLTIPRTKNEGAFFEVSVDDQGKHIDLGFKRIRSAGLPSWQVNVEITGLAKYLGRIDELTATAELIEPADFFHLWMAIEKALTSRSRFFTLIDVYGHYANRGDTIRVWTKLTIEDRDLIHKALAFFGNSVNCGDFLHRNALASVLEVPAKDGRIDSVIKELRKIRFDVRTSETHPIIGSERVLCTYPFPLLSSRALVESRVQFTEDAPQLSLI